MINLLPLLLAPKAKGIVSIAGAALMVIMPDEIDHIIEGLLGFFGVGKIVGGNGERK